MSTRPTLGAVLAVLLTATCGGATTPADPQGFALVELFTSEGCSSCPPADELLAQLADEARRSGDAVYCLSFHVDYWDSLGWKDPYSDPAFTGRQADYARFLGVRGPYTPQMVINGSDQFVGSGAAQARKSIRAFLARKAAVALTLTTAAGERTITVDWKLAGAPTGALLHLAWAQAEGHSSPDRGENAARKLRHVQVVRVFRTVELGPEFAGSVTLTPPSVDGGSVIGFVQDARTGKILAAARGGPGS